MRSGRIWGIYHAWHDILVIIIGVGNGPWNGMAKLTKCTNVKKFSNASTSYNKGAKRSQGNPGDFVKNEKPDYRCIIHPNGKGIILTCHLDE